MQLRRTFVNALSVSIHLPQETPPMRTPKLDADALVVESFPTGPVIALEAPTTTRPMNTNEPGCTLPELCGTTVLA